MRLKTGLQKSKENDLNKIEVFWNTSLVDYSIKSHFLNLIL